MLQRNQHISTEVMTAIILISGLATIAYFGVSGKVNNIFLVAIFPFAALFFGVSVRYPIVSLLSYGIVASFWGIIYRILIRQSNISILLEISLIYFFACMLFHVFITRDLNWKRAINAMTLGYAVWFLFCFMEILNPRGLTEAWINARGFYPSTLLFAIFCSVLLSRYKLVKILVMTIAIFTIIAFIKMLVQKYIGFDQYERNWLYSTRSYTTHILSSGIRYFSIFSDAGNFGSNMGNVTIVYAIIAFNTLEKKLRLFYFIISALGLIGLFLSGTRGAMIVPLGGLMLFCLIIKNVKLTLMSGILGVCIYVFFAFTYIGEGKFDKNSIMDEDTYPFLAPLQILKETGKNTYEKRSLTGKEVPLEILIYSIAMDNIDESSSGRQINIDKLMEEKRQIGKYFGMKYSKLLELLVEAENKKYINLNNNFGNRFIEFNGYDYAGLVEQYYVDKER